MRPPMLEKQLLPSDPSMYVIHQSHQHLPIYTEVYERFFGRRRSIGELAPPALCRERCEDPDPIDPDMRARLRSQPVTLAPAWFDDGRAFSWDRLYEHVDRARDGRATGLVAADPMLADAPPSLALAQALDHRLPGLDDAQLAHVLVQARDRAGIASPDELGAVLRHGDNVFVTGRTPGFQARVDLGTGLPPLQVSIDRISAIDAAATTQDIASAQRLHDPALPMPPDPPAPRIGLH